MRCIRTFTVQLTVVLLAWTGLASLVMAGSPAPRYYVVDLGTFAALRLGTPHGSLLALLPCAERRCHAHTPSSLMEALPRWTHP